MHAARSAIGVRSVGEPRVGFRDVPQPGQRLARRRRSRRRAATNVPRTSDAPRAGLLADPPHLAAEQGRPAARRTPPRPRSADGRGGAPGSPPSRPARTPPSGRGTGGQWSSTSSRAGRQVVADAVGRLAPPLVGEQAVEPGQRPVRLAGEVLRVEAGRPAHRSSSSYSARTAPDGSVWAARNRPSAASSRRRRSSPVSSAPLDEPGGEQGRGPDGGAPVERDGGPVRRARARRSRGPVDAAVGALQRAGDARRRRLVQAHDRAGVADDVVVVEHRVGRPASYWYSHVPSAFWLRANQSTASVAAACSHRRVTSGQCSGGATTPKATTAATSSDDRRRTAIAASGSRADQPTLGTCDGAPGGVGARRRRAPAAATWAARTRPSAATG